jgi:hypothetical protein
MGGLAAKNATKTIPIIMATGSEAVENGVVASLARPGGNVTGLSEHYATIHTKLLGLLHETLPEVTRVAFLVNTALGSDGMGGTGHRTRDALQATAPSLAISLRTFEYRHEAGFDGALQAAAHERPGALIVPAAIYTANGPRIAEVAAKTRIPVFSSGGQPQYNPCRGSQADERAALLRERTQLATAIRHLVDAVKLGRATGTLLAELATQETALKGLERRIADIDGSRVVVPTDSARLTARVAAAAREFRAMLKDGGPRARRVLQRVLDGRRVPCEPFRDPGRRGYRFREEKVPYAGLFTDLGGPNGTRCLLEHRNTRNC